MSRTNGSERRGGRRSTPTPFQLALALAAGLPVFTADYYSVDGVTGKVASFIDWSASSHTLSQSTSAKQVAIPAAHADFGNKICATFTGAQRYGSSKTAAYWDYMANGPWDFASILTPTQTGAVTTIYQTGPEGSGFGAAFLVDNGGTIRLNITRVSASNQQLNVAYAVNTPYYAYGHVAAGASPQRSLKISGVTAATGSLAGGATSGTHTLVFGSTAADTTPLQARVAVLLHHAPLLSTAQRNTRAQWAATYGAAA